jgi:hypothetical protein
MDTNEIYMQMAELWTEFSTEHSKTSKAAHGRARRNSQLSIQKQVKQLMVEREAPRQK